MNASEAPMFTVPAIALEMPVPLPVDCVIMFAHG
jgi:hypothetical protein